MDTGLRCDKMCHDLKTEEERHPSLRLAVLANPWDSVESDTESLAQERAYQQQLQMRLDHQDQIKFILSPKERAASLQKGDRVKEDETEDDFQVYDSLEVAAHSHTKKKSELLQTKYLETQVDKREGASLQLSDSYSDLRYDPNWRANLKGAGRFNESQQISFEEHYQNPKETSSQTSGGREGPVIKGGYRYIADTSPAPVGTPHLAGNVCGQSYRLHPQNDQSSSVTSSCCLDSDLQLGSPEADLSEPFCVTAENECHNTLQTRLRGKGENSCDGENIGGPFELTEDIQAMHIGECQTYDWQELRHTQGGPTQTQQRRSTSSMSPKALLSKKLGSPTDDIVERNKITLGRNTSKYGSYVKAHTLQQEMPHNVKKVHMTSKETGSTESQEDTSPPKPRLPQKAEHLRATQISTRKKAQRKEYPKPSQQQQQPPAAPGVKAEHGDSLSSPLTKPAAMTQPKPQKTTSSQPLPPTIHLNIHVNAPTHLPPLLQQTDQEAFIHLASLLSGRSHWNSASEVVMSSGYQQTNLGKSTHMTQEKLTTQPPRQNLESISEQLQRTAALKWPSSHEEADQRWSPNEVHTNHFAQNLPRTPTSTLSQASGSYQVLPPIGKLVMGQEPELSVNTAYPIHRSSSDGYLVQMEKHKQIRARVTYKAYSLKDYKQLKSDIKLRGLGPDYAASEKTKMKRQKLYSDVIRQQNKKISRIPFPPTKDPEGNDKKVPRMKALEYAKTIAKPPIQPQPKQRQKHPSEGFSEHAPYLEGLDASQLATLELLRKRHEEEKQAVALFRKVHAV